MYFNLNPKNSNPIITFTFSESGALRTHNTYQYNRISELILRGGHTTNCFEFSAEDIGKLIDS